MNYTLETYLFLLINVTPINRIKNKEEEETQKRVRDMGAELGATRPQTGDGLAGRSHQRRVRRGRVSWRRCRGSQPRQLRGLGFVRVSLRPPRLWDVVTAAPGKHRKTMAAFHPKDTVKG